MWVVEAWCEIDVNEWTRHDWTASERRQRIVWSFMVEIACLREREGRRKEGRKKDVDTFVVERMTHTYCNVYVLA